MSSDFKPQNYLRSEAFPSIWCPGCGHGAVLNGLLGGIHRAGISKDDLVAVGGIGCSGRAAGLMDCDGMMTTHGRPLAFGTGMKMTHPEKQILILTGDGDCGAIGGNHFIHAARRNIDMTIILFNNSIYGMTGGQVSPTTPKDAWSTTTPLGNKEPAADMCGIAIAAGASFVARTTAYHSTQIASLVAKGFANKGFSLIEVISPCPTGFGRKNRFGSATEMFQHLKKAAIPAAKASHMSTDDLNGRIVTGVLCDSPKTEYSTEYQKIIATAQKSSARMDQYLPRLDNVRPGKAQIRLSGSGGQGLVLGGIMLAEAAIMVGKRTMNSQAYGPEARGGAARAEVIIDDQPINHVEVTRPDILVCLNQESADQFVSSMAPDGLLILDTTLVEDPPSMDGKCVLAPLTDIAKNQLGNIFDGKYHRVGYSGQNQRAADQGVAGRINSAAGTGKSGECELRSPFYRMVQGRRMGEVLIMAKKSRLCPDINRKWCKNCGICVVFCNQDVFDRDSLGRPVMSRPEQCNGCRSCLLRCPDIAIELIECDA